MFTGITEEKGTVLSLTIGESACVIKIGCKAVLDGLKQGDSIAVNGVCLTAVAFNGESFTADIMPETLKRSSLGLLKSGSHVNLERAMAADGRFGGHIVSGHIDGTGKILSAVKDKNAVLLTIGAKSGLLKYIIEKGSVAIDGVSLTVTFAERESFGISLIPHTAKSTALLEKYPGDTVNIECDVIGKYVERLLGFKEPLPQEKSSLTMDFLIKNGF